MSKKKKSYEHEYKNGKCIKCGTKKNEAINHICPVIGKEEVSKFSLENK